MTSSATKVMSIYECVPMTDTVPHSGSKRHRIFSFKPLTIADLIDNQSDW